MIRPWKKISETPAYRGKFRKMDMVRYELPNGKEKGYEIMRSGQVVVIVALTPDKKVILVEQFRPGPEKVLCEIPAGWRDPDETPEHAAARELLEETGYEGDLTCVGTTFQSAYSDMTRYMFVAQDCRKVKEPEGDGDEFIEPVLVSLDEFREHLRSGELTDVASGYRALDFLKLL